MAKASGILALAGFEDIFNVGAPQNGVCVTEVALTDLHAPDCHPFQVNDDEAMTRLVESVKQYGVREPGLARPRPTGGHELLCGNRRKRASKLVGLEKYPLLSANLTTTSPSSQWWTVISNSVNGFCRANGRGRTR
jgi:ParB family chromosome partitioning protein